MGLFPDKVTMIITVLDVVLFSTYFILLFLSTFWLIVLFSKDPKQSVPTLTHHPFFSTIVPAYNEQKSIQETLLSLLNLDYPLEKREIIVVNDGSTDDTQAKVEQFMQQHPQANVQLINQQNQGKGAALNTGLALIKGKYFACLDADSFIASNALQVMLPVLEQDENTSAICPILKVRKPQTLLEKVQWVEYIVNMFYKYLNAKLQCIHVTPGPFSIYRTAVIKKIGGFDTNTITEDLEIAIRMQKHHYTIRQSFDTIVETNAPTSWKFLFRQRVRWYKGSLDNTLRYRKLIFNREYGDFGFIRMPTIVFAGVLAVVLTAALTHSIISRAVTEFMYLKDVNFDILTLLKAYSFHLNLLTLPYFKIFIATTLFTVSIFVMVYSYRLVQEKITNYGKTWTSLVTYLSLYGLFITVVWLYIAYTFVTKRKDQW